MALPGPQFALAAAAVLWDSAPILVRSWQSLTTRHLSLLTLTALSLGVAWVLGSMGPLA